MNIEKTGKTCIEKKYKGFEKPVDKIKRWKRNIGTFGIDEKITFIVGIEGKYLWMKDMKK